MGLQRVPKTLSSWPRSDPQPLLRYFQPSSGGGRDPVGHVLELKLKALILDTIHSIDVVQSLVHSGVKAAGRWLWQKQLRFYLKDGMVGHVCVYFKPL